MQRYHMESVIEILAKTAGGHLLQGIAIGGTDDAHIHLLGHRGAYFLKTARLQEAQQFALQLQLHLADLIHKQGATVCSSRGANPLADRAGIGAFDVTEDLALHQVLGDRRTVERHQLLALTAAQPVDRFGTQLLAGTTLAGDEDGGSRGRRCLDGAIDRLHGDAGSHEPFELLPRIDGLITADQGIQPAVLDGVAQGDSQALGIDGFNDVIVSP